MSDVPTALLGVSNRIRMSDNILLRRMYGCSKYQRVYQHFVLVSILIPIYHLGEEFTSPAPPACKDKKSSCNHWKGLGYCTQKYVGYMYAQCPETCGFCEEATTIPTTSSTTTATPTCGKPNWKGDNWCDDMNNNEGL